MGCIRVVKETFTAQGNPLTPVAQFTFMLDGYRSGPNDSTGLMTFYDVPVGTHTVTENVADGWNQVNVTPTGGFVAVFAGQCSTVVFRNQQKFLITYTPSPPPPLLLLPYCLDGDVTVTKVPDRFEAQPGDLVTYTLMVQNRGHGIANDVILEDAIDGRTSIIVDPGGAQVNGSVLRWMIGRLNPGQSRTMNVTTRTQNVHHGDTIANTATMHSSCGTRTAATGVHIIEQLPQTGFFDGKKGNPSLTKITKLQSGNAAATGVIVWMTGTSMVAAAGWFFKRRWL